MALVALVSLIAAIQINASREQEHEQRVEALRQTSLADDQRRRAEERSLELQRLSARIELDEGLAMCEQGDVARGMLHLGRSLELVPPDSPELERLIRTCLAGWADRLITLRAQLATGGKVRAVLSRDGTRVATASDDHTARVWDGATGRPLTPPLAHDDEVNGRRSAPTGPGSSPRRTIGVRGSGTWGPAGSSSRRWFTAARSMMPRSAPMGHASSPPATTARHRSGTRQPAAPSACPSRMATRSFEPRSARTAPASPRPAGTGPRGSGMRRPDSPGPAGLKHGGWVTGVAFSPDGAAPHHNLRRRHGAGLGYRERGAARIAADPSGPRQSRRVQSGWKEDPHRERRLLGADLGCGDRSTPDAALDASRRRLRRGFQP